MAQLFSNNAQSSLLNPILAGDLSIELAVGGGNLFSTPTGGDFEVLVIIEGGVSELITVTGRAGDVLTVTRASENTTASAFSAGAIILCSISKQTMESVTASVINVLANQIAIATNASAIDLLNINLDISNGHIASQGNRITTNEQNIFALLANSVQSLQAKLDNLSSRILSNTQAISSFHDELSDVALINQNGDTLVNQNGDILVNQFTALLNQNGDTLVNQNADALIY